MSTTTDDIPEPAVARPWRPSDGEQPRVTTWPPGNRPALRVWSHGAWRYAPVRARQDWADGRVFYQVEIDLRGDTTVVTRMYEWPQPGLRAPRAPRQQRGGGSADMPRPMRRRAPGPQPAASSSAASS
ncbi:hypothetical protein [Streptomyces coeruleorubidus]|uniref:hypothetical protein n=1 Tax=Streptomyces coeruleorubidus TaxID=116188 RepID=UPI0033AF00AC